MTVRSIQSVQVSWERIPIPEVLRYILYYSRTDEAENSKTLSSSASSVVIGGLVSNAEYQFQMVVVAEVYGDILTGERSPPVTVTMSEPPSGVTSTDTILVRYCKFPWTQISKLLL